MENNNYKRIKVVSADGTVIEQWEGDIKVFWEDKIERGYVHFLTVEDGKHHKIYGENCVIVEEI